MSDQLNQLSDHFRLDSSDFLQQGLKSGDSKPHVVLAEISDLVSVGGVH